MGAPRRAPRPRGVLPVASVLLVAIAAGAAVVASEPATVRPTAIGQLPVTLTAAPLSGTTVTAGTSAQTVGLTPTLVAASTLTMARAGHDWKVVLAVTSASGITGAETLVLAVAGASTQSLTLAAGTTYPQATAGLTLDAAGLSVTVATTSLLSGCHGCTAAVELRVTPPSSPLPSFTYPYAIATAA